MNSKLLLLLPVLGGAFFLSKPADQQVQFAVDKKAGHWGCVQACKPAEGKHFDESTCVTACESEFYNCGCVECQDKVLKKFTDTKGVAPKAEGNATEGNKTGGGNKTEGKKADKKKKAAFLGDAPLVKLSAEAKKAAHFGCVSACKPSPVESKCVTACEAAHYQCLDVACQEANLKHFTETKGIEKKEEGNKTEGNATKGDKKDAKKKEEKKKAALLGDAPLVVLSAEAKKAAHFGCVKACQPSPVESKCVTACEAAHYQCLDVACQEANLKKFTETKGIEVKKGNATEGNATKADKKDAKKEEKKK